LPNNSLLPNVNPKTWNDLLDGVEKIRPTPAGGQRMIMRYLPASGERPRYATHVYAGRRL
jgi:hypothetical protein